MPEPLSQNEVIILDDLLTRPRTAGQLTEPRKFGLAPHELPPEEIVTALEGLKRRGLIRKRPDSHPNFAILELTSRGERAFLKVHGFKSAL